MRAEGDIHTHTYTHKNNREGLSPVPREKNRERDHVGEERENTVGERDMAEKGEKGYVGEGERHWWQREREMPYGREREPVRVLTLGLKRINFITPNRK